MCDCMSVCVATHHGPKKRCFTCSIQSPQPNHVSFQKHKTASPISLQASPRGPSKSQPPYKTGSRKQAQVSPQDTQAVTNKASVLRYVEKFKQTSVLGSFVHIWLHQGTFAHLCTTYIRNWCLLQVTRLIEINPPAQARSPKALQPSLH